MLAELRSYLLLNDSNALSNAVRLYFSIRPDLLAAIRAEVNIVRMVGWGTAAFRAELLERLSDQTPRVKWFARRRLRPDLITHFGRRAITWGFVIKSGRNTPPRIDLSATLQTKTSRHALRNSEGLGIIDRVWYQSRGNHLRNELEKNMIIMLEIWEATCDTEVAGLAAERLSSFGLTDLELNRFELIANRNGAERLDPSWVQTELRPVSWRESDRTNSIGRIPQFKRTSFGYTASLSAASTRNVPQPKYAQLRDIVVGEAGLVFSDEALWDIDPVRRPHRGFIAGQWQLAVGSSNRLNQAFVKWPSSAAQQIETAIVLMGRVDSNWFHWLIETLPRLSYCESIIPTEVPILVSSDVLPAGLEALRAATKRTIIQAQRGHPVRVREAFLPGPNVYHSDLEIEGWDAGLGIDFQSINWMKTAVLQNRQVRDDLPRKIYWARGGGVRGIRNRAEVDAIISRHGFVTIHPEAYSLDEQIDFVHNATHFIAPGGAVMANFQFLKPGAKVMCMASEFASRFPMPAHLALNLGHPYQVIEGRSIADRSNRTYNDLLHRDYVVSSSSLYEGIDEMLRS